jgi:hypothetical protein
VSKLCIDGRDAESPLGERQPLARGFTLTGDLVRVAVMLKREIRKIAEDN